MSVEVEQLAWPESSLQSQATAMHEVLADIAEVEGVQSTFLAGADGLIVASEGDAVEIADLRAALIAAIFATVDRAISQLQVGEARLASIETTSHSIHVARLQDLILAVIADRQASASVIRWEIRRAARRLALLPA